MSVAIVPTPGPGDGPVVVALGDSVTGGVGDAAGPGAPHGPGWAGWLADLAGASCFVNLASDGARARHVVAEQLPRALALLPDVATVVVGGNDVLRSDFCAHDVARDLSTAVTALRDVGATVVLARLPAIGLFELTPPVVRQVVRARVAQVNAVVDAVAHASRPGTVSELGALRASRAAPGTDRGPGIDDGRGRGAVVVVDVADAARLAGRAAWHADRVHLSPAGHRALAAVAAVALDRAGVIALPESAGATVPVSAPAQPMACAGTDSPWGDALVSARARGMASARADRRAGVLDEARALLATMAPCPTTSTGARLAWLVVAGLPWCVRRGRDLVPGLARAVVDMDGTLLDPDGEVPATLGPLLGELRERGVLLVPASGRQYATLARTFAGALEGMPV
ncbi:GDSL-type esterase/lipase family protein, partial [Puerhibacterium puerhi]|uniref:GDSL-type esterase/lipase family protein n=1 Tax=Puerhibacterium puerhi TaxID=2692623 RepID=UPI001916C481